MIYIITLSKSVGNSGLHILRLFRKYLHFIQHAHQTIKFYFKHKIYEYPKHLPLGDQHLHVAQDCHSFLRCHSHDGWTWKSNAFFEKCLLLTLKVLNHFYNSWGALSSLELEFN